VRYIIGARAIARRLGVTATTVLAWHRAGKLPWLNADACGKLYALEKEVDAHAVRLRKEKRVGGQKYAGRS